MDYYEAKQERNRALLQSLGLLEDEEPATEAEGKVDFDGGAREGPPLPGDPEQEHNEFLLKLFENTKLGGGGEW